MDVYSNYTFSQLVRHIELLDDKLNEHSANKYVQLICSLTKIPLSEKTITLLLGNFSDCIFCNTVSNNFAIKGDLNKPETNDKLFLFNNKNQIDVICKTCITDKITEKKYIELI